MCVFQFSSFFAFELISIVPVVFFAYFFHSSLVFVRLFIYSFAICYCRHCRCCFFFIPLIVLMSLSLSLYLTLFLCVCISTDYSLKYSFHCQNWYMLSSSSAHCICIKRCAHLQQFVFFGISFFSALFSLRISACSWLAVFSQEIAYLKRKNRLKSEEVSK